MKEKKQSAKKGLASISPEFEALVKEVEESVHSWQKEPTLFFQKLRSLPAEQQEALFLGLLKKERGELLSLVEALIGREEKVDLALAKILGNWISPRAPLLLHQLASVSNSKVVRKSIRKSLFQLKSYGLEIREIQDLSPAVYHPPQPGLPEGYFSSMDSTGTRLVWLARPQPLQGIFAFHALISDLRGIIDFSGFETSRKKFHEYLEDFRKEDPWEIVEADPEYCHGLILEASEIHQKKEQPPPEDFVKWRPLMGAPPQLPLKPLIYLYLKEEELKSRSDLLDRSGSLFQLSSFQTWFLEKQEVQNYIPLLKEASETRLVLTPYQKEARVMDIYRQAVEELFDKPRRALFKRRLEEIAYVLWKTGKQSEAQMSLAAALGMETEGGIFFIHPFLLELVKRSLTAQIEEEAKEREKEAGLLIRP